MCRQVHSCDRTIQTASDLSLYGWPGCARDCATRHAMAVSFIFGGTRIISRNTGAENFAVLEQILDEFDQLAATDGMESLTMADVAARVASSAPSRTRDSG